MTETDVSSKTMGVAAALAVLALGACGAASFGMGSGATAGAPGAGPGARSMERVPPARSIDPDDEITSGTDRANAATPNNAGRAKTYPHGPELTTEQRIGYGPAEAEHGDGYYVSIYKRYAILVGYTVEIATKRARLTGFDGTIRVSEADQFDPSCADGIVCSIYPESWQGSGETGQLILYVNRHMKISSPD